MTDTQEKERLEFLRAKASKAIVNNSITRLLADARVPKPADSILIEFPRDYNMGILAAGVPVRGRIDLTDVNNPQHIVVWDWKTTGKLKSAKTAEELLTNPQYLIYLKYIFERFNPKHTSFVHGNIQTSAPGYSIVRTEPACRQEAEEKYSLLVESTVEKMKLTTAAEKVDDVPYNTKACWAFGKPCPYTAVCPLNTSVSFSQSFNRRNEESSTMPPIDVKELLNKQLKAQNSTAEVTTTVVADTTKTTAMLAKGINPPDAAKPNPVAKYVPPEVTATPVPVQGEYAQPAKMVLLIDAGVRFLRSPAVLPQPVIDLAVEIEDRSKEVIEEARKLKKANEHTVDVRQIPFGEGKIALIASFKTRPLTGTVVARAGGLSSEVLEVLETQADLVIGR